MYTKTWQFQLYNRSKYFYNKRRATTRCIELFCRKCLNDTVTIIRSLTKLDIENPPSAMEQLYKLFNNFIDPQVKSKIQILSKK